MMTRRRLILTALGALGAAACAPVSQVVKFSSPPTWPSGRPRTGQWSGEYEVLGDCESPEADPGCPMCAIGTPSIGCGEVPLTEWVKPKTPIDELFVSVGGDSGTGPFMHQMSGVRAFMSPDEIQQFGAALDELMPPKPWPLVTIGPLIISNEAEAEAFMERMVNAIQTADRRQA